MKYADMAKDIAADKHAKATGAKDPSAPIREPLPKPNTTDPKLFRMWKGASGKYFGTVPVPRDMKRGESLLIEAYLVEAEALGELPPRKGFEGPVYDVTRMLQTGKLVGDPAAMPKEHRDLLTPLEQQPFNDQLPGESQS